ncbi:MAG TPA: hypothetical protein PLV92_14295, partial [Pirellulaceae bacterium]|nr:hypothetical protein [Pirellulaceae bacterium]
LSELQTLRSAYPTVWHKRLIITQFGVDVNAGFKLNVHDAELFGTGVILDGTLTASLSRNAPAIDGAIAPAGSTVVVTVTDGNLHVPGFADLHGSFTLQNDRQTITLADGTSATVDMLRIGGEDVSAFVGLNGPYLVDSNGDGAIDQLDEPNADAMGLALQGVRFGAALMSPIAGQSSVAGLNWTALKASAESVALVGIPDLTLAARGLAVDVNLVSGVPVGTSPSSRVVDFGSRPLNISTGAGTEIELDLDGGDGELMRASGSLDVTVGEFFHVAGDLSIEKSTRSLKLSNGQTTSLDVLSIAGVDLQAFAGFGGDQPVGLTLDDVNFGLALLSDPNAPEKTYTALTATASNAAFAGLTSLVAQGADLSVEINRGTAAGVVVDFAAQPLVLTAGGQTITFDIDGDLGELTRAAGHLDLQLGEFFSVEGDFALEKSQTQVTLDDQSKVDVDLLMIGASGVTAFAGLNGGTSAAVGFALHDLDFGLALAHQSLTDEPDRNWLALQASAASGGFYGGDTLEASGTDLSIEITRGAIDGSLLDFFADPIEVHTGPGASDSIRLAFDAKQGPITRLEGAVELNVAGYFQVSGDLQFDLTTAELPVAQPPAPGDGDGEQEIANVKQLIIGASGVDAFIGLNGGSPDAIGFEAHDVEFALALSTDVLDPTRQWTSLSAAAGSVAFVGVDGLTLDATDVEVDINRASVGGVLDFSAEPLVVATGPGRTREIDFSGSLGQLTRARATLDVNLFDFFSVNGDFEFVQSQGSVKLSDGGTINADLMTLGGNDVNAFAGINFGDGDQVGVSLGGVNFGLAFIVDQADASRQFTSLQATADSASFSGID